MVCYSLENRLEYRLNLRNNRQSQPILPIGPALSLSRLVQRHERARAMRRLQGVRKGNALTRADENHCFVMKVRYA